MEKIIQATQAINQDINMEDVLKMMCTIDGASQYVVTNSEGIPIKKSPNITPERALQISFLINDYWSTARKIIQNDLKQVDNAVEEIRIRTSKQQQIIVIQSFRKNKIMKMVNVLCIWSRIAKRKSLKLKRKKSNLNDDFVSLQKKIYKINEEKFGREFFHNKKKLCFCLKNLYSFLFLKCLILCLIFLLIKIIKLIR